MREIPGRQAGRHVVITGGGSGIGRSVALRLAAEGARVSILGRRLGALEDTAASVAAQGSGAAFIAGCDVRIERDIEQAFDGAVAQHGPIHALVAAAGIGGANLPGAGDRFDDLIATNLTGTYRCLRAAQSRLAAGPELRQLVVIASILARFGVPGYTGYCASKTALLGLVRAMAFELAGDGVLVNAICPGWVDTEMAWAGIDEMARGMKITREQAFAEAMKQVPLGQMSRPEDVAGMIAWLLSGDARGVTGQSLDMNNGAWM